MTAALASPSVTVLAHRDGLPEFDAWSVLTQARPDLLPLLLVLVPGCLYLYGVRRLTARGDRWPLGRTLSFLVGGLGTIAVATMSGLAAYDESLFAAHMVQHMLLSMVATVFLALGAPITLALRTLPLVHKRRVMAVLHSRFAAVMSHPLVPWLLFVSSPFLLYFTGWYEATLENRVLHELLHLHFLVVGSLFFWPLLGVDPVPGRSGHPFRMLLVAATLPFHAFLGVSIMSVEPDGRGLLAPDHYLPLHGLAESVFQQQLGGGLLWASGDLVGLLFLGVLLTQWMRASQREAVREDRRLDRLEAAERSSEPAQPSAPRPRPPEGRGVGLLARWRARRAPAPVVLDPDDPSLVVVVEAYDAARADSAVLAEAAERGVDLDAPVLLRHHLVALPDEAAVERAAELLAQDGYALSAPRPDARGLAVYATRTQVVTALSASQERSRMAGLAQRLGGDVGGWDALAPQQA